MATSILLLCFLYISAAMGYSSKYIIGGYPADIQDFPYQISIKHYEIGHTCGGAVITEKFIITAAHCFYDQDNQVMWPINNLTIFVGSTKLSGNGQTYAVEHMIHHAGFNLKEYLYDIGLIGVKNKIIFNKYVKPISILTNNVPVGSMLTVSGWGRINPEIDLSDTLLMLPVSVINLKDCQTALKYDGLPVQNSQICTFAKIHKGTCFGDSGGPLALNGLLVGLVSWGSFLREKPDKVFCARGKPDVNTKVSKYIKWIKTTINKYCKTRTCPKKKLYPEFVTIKKHNRSNILRFKNLLYYRG